MTKNLFYTILLSIVNILFPILSFPYASHILGPAGIGKVQFVISFAQYFALFAALGIPIYGIKESARHRGDPKKLSIIFTELTTIFFVASLVLFVVYLAVIFSIPFFSTDRHMFMYAGVLILLSFSYTDWFYAGIEEFRGITLRSVLVKTISLILLYSFIKTEGDFEKYLLIVIFSILGNQVLSFIMVFRKTNFIFSDLDFRKHVQPILYIFSASVAASIYTVLDTVLLGFLSTEKAVGLYTASVKLIKITIPIITSMGVILIPSISKNFAGNNMDEIKQLLAKSFNFLVFLSIPVGFGLAILAPEFIIIFSGDQFITASTSMQILASLPVLIGFGHFFCFQILMPAGRNKEIFFSMLAGVFICLILNFALVPTFHEVGASIANICTELIVTLSYFYFIKKHYTFTYNWKFVIQSIAGSLLFFPVIFITREFHLDPLVTLLTSITLCAGLYICTQLFIFKNTFLFTFITPLKKKFLQYKSPEND